ncbi:serine/threonine-protein phosphatase 2A regulatory subunit B'' subunit beta isoform X2 [Myotis daubentonii]|uniref:serine/threonine-protein phosphatase 2A regulatory subunit B'' subunit beta isoform X2 n=1 Tax=Myotis daubentonii TaxID=98922 RepID=UPI0028738FC0|nr:serine/threonine-protein phosphatase 2A regulatory subunit B'' subunit beta isoform X2 [Myotis daubentonii]
MERAEPGRPARPTRGCRPDPPGPPGPPQPQPREPGPRPGRPMRPDMRLRELSLRQDPDLRQELASLARGCDFVLPSRFKKRLKAFQQVQTKKEEPRPPAASQSIPAFYFPRGRPQGTADSDAVIARIERTFAQFPHERAAMEDMGKVAKACGCPLYWKGPLFCAAGGERTGSVSVHKFVAMWRKPPSAQDPAELPRRGHAVRAPAHEPGLQLPGAGGLRPLPAGRGEHAPGPGVPEGGVGVPLALHHHRHPADLLHGQQVLVRQDHLCRAPAELLPAERGAAGGGGGHQPADGVLLLRALLRHLLQVLGAGHRPRPAHRPAGPGPAQRPRHLHQDDREDLLGSRDAGPEGAGGEDQLRRLRVVPDLRGGQEDPHQHRVLVPLHGPGRGRGAVHVRAGALLRGAEPPAGGPGHRGPALRGLSVPDARPGPAPEPREDHAAGPEALPPGPRLLRHLFQRREVPGPRAEGAGVPAQGDGGGGPRAVGLGAVRGRGVRPAGGRGGCGGALGRRVRGGAGRPVPVPGPEALPGGAGAGRGAPVRLRGRRGAAAVLSPEPRPGSERAAPGGQRVRVG